MSSLFYHLVEEQLQTPKILEKAVHQHRTPKIHHDGPGPADGEEESLSRWAQGHSVNAWQPQPFQGHLLCVLVFITEKKYNSRQYMSTWASCTHHPASVSLNSWSSWFLHLDFKANHRHPFTHKYFRLTKRRGGTSLVFQWVRPHAPNAGGPGLIPGWELDPACMPQLRVCMLQLRSLHAATKRSRMLQWRSRVA